MAVQVRRTSPHFHHAAGILPAECSQTFDRRSPGCGAARAEHARQARLGSVGLSPAGVESCETHQQGDRRGQGFGRPGQAFESPHQFRYAESAETCRRGSHS